MSKQSLHLWPILALLLVVSVGAMYLLRLNSTPLTDRDEGEYAAAVASMQRSGDFLIPRLNGQPYLEKPILLFWSVAAAQALEGQGEAGARLPSAVSAFLLVLAMGFLVMRVSGSLPLAVLAAGATGFMPLMALVGRACLTDMLLTFFTFTALGAFFLANERPAPADRLWYLVGWTALGLGFLTKGPVAAAVVLPTAFLYALVQRRLWQVLKRAQIPWGVLIFLVINLPWYGLVFYKMGDDFWQAFFMSQNLRRFSEVLLGHGGGYFYYLPVLLLGGFPFSAVALPALVSALGRNRWAARQADPVARLRLLAALSVLVVLVVFTLAATKQINYILPAMPFLALLAGYGLWRMAAGEALGKLAGPVFWVTLAVLAGIWLLALLAVPLGVPLFWDQALAAIRPDSSEYALPAQAPALWAWPLLSAALVAAVWALPRWLTRLGQRRLASAALLLMGGAVTASLVLGLLGQAARLVQEPARDMALEVRQHLQAPAQVVSFGLWKPSLLYYLDRDIPRLRVSQTAELGQLLATEQAVLVLSRASLAPDLAQAPGFKEIKTFAGYLLGGNEQGLALWRTPAEASPPHPSTGP